MQDEFEFEGGSELISAHAPRHWRERRALQGVGAFHSLQVRFHLHSYDGCQQHTGCLSMQLSFISDQLTCLVLLLFSLVSMLIMSCYACGEFAMSTLFAVRLSSDCV